MCSFFPCFCLCFCCWRSHWTQLYRFCLRLYRYYKIIFNLHRFPTKRLLHSMLLRIYWIKQIAFLYTSQATISALKNDVNLLRAILQCVRAFTFEKTISTSTTKYKCRCQLGKTEKDLATLSREPFAHANSYNFADKQNFKVFRLSFLETIPIFYIRLKKWFYPYLIAMKFSPLTDFGLNSRDKSFNKKFYMTQINPK